MRANQMRIKLIRVAALLLALTLAFAGSACKKKEPGLTAKSTQAEIAEYLQKAMDKLNAELSAAETIVPNLSRLSGGPAEADWTIGLEEIGEGYAGAFAPYGDLLIGAKLHMDAKTDPTDAKVSLGIDIYSDLLTLAGNELYLSKDLIAVKAPEIFTAAPYVAVSPATFADDWNGSYFGQLSPLPDDAARLFDAFVAIPSQHPALAEEWQAYIGSAATRWGGLAQEMADGVGYAYNAENGAVVVTYSAALATAGVHAVYDSMLDMLDGMMRQYSSMGVINEYIDDYNDSMAELLAEIDAIAVLNDAEFTYHFDDKGRVTGISTNRIEARTGDAVSTASVVMNFDGEENLFDHVNISMFMSGEATGESRVSFSRNTQSLADGGKFEAYVVSMDVDGEAVRMEANFTKDAKHIDGNFQAKLLLEAAGESFEMTLDGDLTEKETEVALAGGRLAIAANGEPVVALSVDGAQRKIDAVPAPSAADCKSLFDLSVTELMEIMQVAQYFGMGL